MDWHLWMLNASLEVDTSLLCCIWSQLWWLCRSVWLQHNLPRKGASDGAEGWYRCQSLAKSAICHREPAKSHRPRHAAKLVGGLRWPVIMSWKLSFQHGWLPAAVNATVWTDDRWAKHTFTQKCLYETFKWLKKRVTPSTAKLSGKDYLSWSGIHQKALLVKMWSFCKNVLGEWMSFSTSVHLFYSQLSAICPCCCTALICGAPGHTQMLLPASTMPILHRLQFHFRVIVKQSHVI